jgi:ankyrin repeat protein
MGCSHSAVEILLQAQADANARDEDGSTALMYAVEVCDKPENENQLENIIMSLVAGGADLEAKDDHGQTALDHVKDQPAIKALLATLAGRRRRVEATQNPGPPADG